MTNFNNPKEFTLGLIISAPEAIDELSRFSGIDEQSVLKLIPKLETATSVEFQDRTVEGQEHFCVLVNMDDVRFFVVCKEFGSEFEVSKPLKNSEEPLDIVEEETRMHDLAHEIASNDDAFNQFDKILAVIQKLGYEEALRQYESEDGLQLPPLVDERIEINQLFKEQPKQITDRLGFVHQFPVASPDSRPAREEELEKSIGDLGEFTPALGFEHSDKSILKASKSLSPEQALFQLSKAELLAQISERLKGIQEEMERDEEEYHELCKFQENPTKQSILLNSLSDNGYRESAFKEILEKAQNVNTPEELKALQKEYSEAVDFYR